MKEYISKELVEQVGERFGYPVQETLEQLPTADVQEKKYCRMIPLEPDCRDCTNVFICTNCHQHIHLGFVCKEYRGNFCIECGAELESPNR